MEFLQLISTRFPNGAKLPDDARPPVAPTFDFVDRGKLPSGAKISSAAKAKTGIVWILTDQGAFHAEGDKYAPFDLPAAFKPFQPQINADTRLTQVASDSLGHLWAASSHGLYATDGGNWWQAIDQRDGMPYILMKCLFLTTNGDVWGGTEAGAWRLRDGTFRYFYGKRWLPGNSVSQIWSDAAGRIWLLTEGGTACIEEKPLTLREKAARMEAINDARHNRRGFVTGSGLKVKGDPDKGAIFDASDNDGLWTALYIGAESLRYAVTKEPEARAKAKKSMDALLDLERLTGISGFPARAVLTDAEIKAGVTGFDPDETVRLDAEKTKIWFKSPVEKGVWCKGDTSSDELDGHYFAWLLYYDNVADDTEKARIAATCRRVTDNILNHDFTLVGHTGKRTRWGNWPPSALNDDPRWHEERGLNSLELLTYLKVAAYLCKDKKYATIYDELIEKHHYLLNTLTFRRNAPWWAINHSDDELAYTCYYPLLLLEKDPDRRRILVQSIAHTWEDDPNQQTIRQERSPLYNYLYGGCTGKPCAPDEARISLQEWPWELVNYTVQNSHRHDVTLRYYPLDRNRTQLDRALPFSERRVMKWNSDPFSRDEGGDGASEEDGAAFLLPYWLGVHHGYLTREE